MSTFTTDETDETGEDDQHEVRMSRKDIRALEKRAKAAADAEARAAAAERRLALRDAGIPTTGVGKLFEKAYDGPLDAEAIKTAAEEYGILGGGQQVSDDELAAQQRLANNSAGAGAGSSTPDIGAELAAAKTQDEVMAVARKHNLQGINLKDYA